MNKDDETTGCELQKLLSKHGITVCASTALRWRQQLGWTSKSTSYCQMIREVNKEKRLAWAIKNKDMFLEDVIYTDETTVQIETHRRTCCYKKGQKPRYKPKPKHPIKVHVWAGISYRGRTSLCIFEGKMNAPLFVMILERCLCPSCELFTLMDIVLYKTMTLSIALTMQGDSMKKGELVGGPLLQSHRI